MLLERILEDAGHDPRRHPAPHDDRRQVVAPRGDGDQHRAPLCRVGREMNTAPPRHCALPSPGTTAVLHTPAPLSPDPVRCLSHGVVARVARYGYGNRPTQENVSTDVVA